MGVLDLLFPKTCVGCDRFGSYLCVACAGKIEYLNTQICSECYRSAIGGKTHPYCLKRNSLDGVLSLANYNAPIRELIQQLKYKFTTDLLSEFGDKFDFSKVSVRREGWVLLALPLHRSRENFRGFNQSELLGKVVAKKLKLNFESKILERTLATSQQVGLTKIARERNVKGVFRVIKKLRAENYYIFDDVWTSGASLKSAAAELKKAGAKTVWGLTLAHPR